MPATYLLDCAQESALLAIDCDSVPCCDLIGSCEGKLNSHGGCHFIGEDPSIGDQASEEWREGAGWRLLTRRLHYGIADFWLTVSRHGTEPTSLWLLAYSINAVTPEDDVGQQYV